LKREAKKRKIKPKELRWYLKSISYKIKHKEEKAIKLFLKKSRKLKRPER